MLMYIMEVLDGIHGDTTIGDTIIGMGITTGVGTNGVLTTIILGVGMDTMLGTIIPLILGEDQIMG